MLGKGCMLVGSSRAYGERHIELSEQFYNYGSPPHTGNTGYFWDFDSYVPAHPRAYGEHPRAFQKPQHFEGSSPRIRGTQSAAPSLLIRLGLIPAHTGNPPQYPAVSHHDWAHPRAYGEPLTARVDFPVPPGSSPCIRGTRRKKAQTFAPSGLIPAHTGNPSPGARAGKLSSAHPRAYGEPRLQTRRSRLSMGSSPRIRGTRSFLKSISCCRGLIPAHTGNPLSHKARCLAEA